MIPFRMIELPDSPTFNTLARNSNPLYVIVHDEVQKASLSSDQRTKPKTPCHVVLLRPYINNPDQASLFSYKLVKCVHQEGFIYSADYINI